MIPICILFMSFGAMGRFVFAYCRTLLLIYAKVELSPKTLEVAGSSGETCEASEFHRVLGLARLASYPRDDVAEIRAVTAYYRVMGIAGRLLAPVSPAAVKWTRRELSRCTHFAAVTLDRRLTPILY